MSGDIMDFRKKLAADLSNTALQYFTSNDDTAQSRLKNLEATYNGVQNGTLVLEDASSCEDIKTYNKHGLDDDMNGNGDTSSYSGLGDLNKCLADAHLELERIRGNERNIVEDAIRGEKDLNAEKLGAVGDYLAYLGDMEVAKEFYQRAEKTIATESGKAWYSLIRFKDADPATLAAHEGEIYSLYEKSRDIALSLAKIKSSDISSVLSRSPEFGSTLEAGKPEEWLMVYALAWQLNYDGQWSKETPDQENIAAMEDERRKIALSRLNYDFPLTVPEAALHLENLEKVARVKTMRFGEIERALRTDGEEQANDIQHRMWSDTKAVEELVKQFRTDEAKDPFTEGLADITRMLWFDGYFRMDLSSTAHQNLISRVLPEYGNADSVKEWLASLKKDLPHWFDEAGNVKPVLDMSNTEIGQNAASRTRSAYLMSNDTARETYLPILSSVGGALLCSEGSPLLMALCASGAGTLTNGGNVAYDVLSSRKQYLESLQTGASQISSYESKKNWHLLGWSAGFNTLGSAWTGPVGVTGIKLASLISGKSLVTGFAAGTMNILKDPRAALAGLRTAAGALGVKVVQNLPKLPQFIKNATPLAKLKMAMDGGSLAAMEIDHFLPYAEKDPNKRGIVYQPHTVWGGLGASFLIAHLFQGLFRVAYSGSLIGVVGRIGMEYAIQAEQDVPLRSPNPWRLVMATVESSATSFINKGLMRGEQFLGKKGNPIGNLVMRIGNTLEKNWPNSKRLFTAIIRRGQATYRLGTAVESEKIVPKGNTLAVAEDPLEHGQWKPVERLVYRKPLFTIGGKTVYSPEELTLIEIEGLAKKGIEVRDGKFWRMKTKEGKDLVPKEVELQPLGRIGRLLRIPTKRVSGYSYTFKDTPAYRLDEVRIGGTEIVNWTGRYGKPRPGIGGTALNMLGMAPSVFGINFLLFAPAMYGDKTYQPVQWTANWGIALLFTHPVVQWPLGYDKGLARAAGYAIGAPVNMALTKWFPSYRNQWPGSAKYFPDLDEGNIDSAFKNIGDNMTSFSFVKLFGSGLGEKWMWEPPAVKAFRDKHDAVIKDALTEIAKGQNGKNVEEVDKFLGMFESKLANYDQLDDEKGKKTVRMLAAYIKEKAAEYKADGISKKFNDVVAAHKDLFNRLPILKNDANWDEFIEQLSDGYDQNAAVY